MIDPELVPPFPYFGGKRRIAGVVWARFGDVPNYVEPFLGGGAVLLARPHAPGTETVNDKDAHLANFWRATQHDPEAVARWADWPVSELDLHARHRWLVTTGAARVERLRTDPEHYDAQAAGWWVWGICQWIGGGWCSGTPRRSGAQRPDLHGKGTGILADLSGHTAGYLRRPALASGGRGVFAGAAGTETEQRDRLVALFGRLRDRLRRVRVCCGEWDGVLGPTPTHLIGLTGVFLDPPYGHGERDRELYGTDEDVAPAVAAWARANGDNPLMRIALCGYEGEHAMGDGWTAVRWTTRGGYGNQSQGRGRANARREVVWFSRHCLDPAVRQLALDEAGR